MRHYFRRSLAVPVYNYTFVPYSKSTYRSFARLFVAMISKFCSNHAIVRALLFWNLRTYGRNRRCTFRSDEFVAPPWFQYQCFSPHYAFGSNMRQQQWGRRRRPGAINAQRAVTASTNSFIRFVQFTDIYSNARN
jgi:hypothetical protein